MPRYFFHHRIGDRMIWDGIGVDLPDVQLRRNDDQAAEMWADVLAGRLQPGRIMVVTNDMGQVVFVTAA